MARRRKTSKSHDSKNTAYGCASMLILFSIFTLVSESTTTQAKTITLLFWLFVILSYFINSKGKANELVILSPPVTRKEWGRIQEILSEQEPRYRHFNSKIAEHLNSVMYTDALVANDQAKVQQAIRSFKDEIEQSTQEVGNSIRELLALIHIPVPNNDLKAIRTISYSREQIILQTVSSRAEFPVITRDLKSKEAFKGIIRSISSMVDLIRIDDFSKTSGIPDIDSMTGPEFELYVVEILKNQGFMAHISGKSGDLGVDILAEKDALRYAIQCKRQSNLVSRRAVSDAVAGMSHYECDQAMVITNNYFSPGAKQLAKANNCILIDRAQLTEYIKQLHNDTTSLASFTSYADS